MPRSKSVDGGAGWRREEPRLRQHTHTGRWQNEKGEGLTLRTPSSSNMFRPQWPLPVWVNGLQFFKLNNAWDLLNNLLSEMLS